MEIIQICILLLFSALLSAPTWSLENHLWGFFYFSIIAFPDSHESTTDRLDTCHSQGGLGRWLLREEESSWGVCKRSARWNDPARKWNFSEPHNTAHRPFTRLFMGFCTCDGRARQHRVIAGPQRAELLLPVSVWLNSETCTAKN